MKVISTECTRLHIGDILKVINTAADAFVKAQTSSGDIVKLYHYEYVVLNGYSPRYNGRILFTKGDSTFVTGHIYEVVDGKIDDGYGQYFPLSEDDFFTSFADIKTTSQARDHICGVKSTLGDNRSSRQLNAKEEEKCADLKAELS